MLHETKFKDLEQNFKNRRRKGLLYTFKDEIKKRNGKLRARVAEGTQHILSKLESSGEPVTYSELIENLPEEVNEKKSKQDD